MHRTVAKLAIHFLLLVAGGFPPNKRQPLAAGPYRHWLVRDKLIERLVRHQRHHIRPINQCPAMPEFFGAYRSAVR